MDKDSFIVYIKTNDMQKDNAEDAETRFVTSEYKLEKSLPKRKKKKAIGLMKDELAAKIIKKFVGLRARTYSYLIDDGSEDKKAKDTKKCFSKRKRKFKNCKNCLEATQLANKNKPSRKKLN